MGYVLAPNSCPTCTKPLKPSYTDRRGARVTLFAVGLVVVGFAVMAALTPPLVMAAGRWASGTVEDAKMFHKDKRFVVGLASLVSIPVGMVPGGLIWVYAWTLPKRLRMGCRYCGWQGPCRIKENWDPMPEEENFLDPETIPELIPPEVEPEGPLSVPVDRLERVREARRRKDKAAESEINEPNPDLDFR